MRDVAVSVAWASTVRQPLAAARRLSRAHDAGLGARRARAGRCGAEPRRGRSAWTSPLAVALARARRPARTSRTMDEDVVVVKPAYADAYAARARARAP